jgi:hypothetical protein
MSEVQDGQTATAIVREYTQRAFAMAFWRDVRRVEFDAENNQWIVEFEASPSLVSPYFVYNASVDAKTGRIVRFVKTVTS